jgi:hypothetical protein
MSNRSAFKTKVCDPAAVSWIWKIQPYQQAYFGAERTSRSPIRAATVSVADGRGEQAVENAGARSKSPEKR